MPEPTSTAARAVAVLHEDYHAGRACFVTDPVTCAGHQDAHDVAQLLVHASLLAWDASDTPEQVASGARLPSVGETVALRWSGRWVDATVVEHKRGSMLDLDHNGITLLSVGYGLSGWQWTPPQDGQR